MLLVYFGYIMLWKWDTWDKIPQKMENYVIVSFVWMIVSDFIYMLSMQFYECIAFFKKIGLYSKSAKVSTITTESVESNQAFIQKTHTNFNEKGSKLKPLDIKNLKNNLTVGNENLHRKVDQDNQVNNVSFQSDDVESSLTPVHRNLKIANEKEDNRNSKFKNLSEQDLNSIDTPPGDSSGRENTLLSKLGNSSLINLTKVNNSIQSEVLIKKNGNESIMKKTKSPKGKPFMINKKPEFDFYEAGPTVIKTKEQLKLRLNDEKLQENEKPKKRVIILESQGPLNLSPKMPNLLNINTLSVSHPNNIKISTRSLNEIESPIDLTKKKVSKTTQKITIAGDNITKSKIKVIDSNNNFQPKNDPNYNSSSNQTHASTKGGFENKEQSQILTPKNNELQESQLINAELVPKDIQKCDEIESIDLD